MSGIPLRRALGAAAVVAIGLLTACSAAAPASDATGSPPTETPSVTRDEATATNSDMDRPGNSVMTDTDQAMTDTASAQSAVSAESLAATVVAAVPTPRPKPTPVPVPTPVPPSKALQPTAKNLANKLASFRGAQRAHDIPSMLRLQRELIAAAGSSDDALKDDESPEADSVRQAIADIRAGVAGDNNGMDHAQSELNSVVSGQTGGFIVITSDTPKGDVSSYSLDRLTQDLNNFRQAIKDHNSDGVLKLQGQLLKELPAVQQTVQNDDSDQGRAEREALASLQKGLDGDTQQLAAASAALGKLTPPTSSPAEIDTSKMITSLAGKVDAFQVAASTNSRPDLLRLQQDILTELDRDSAALRGQQSEGASKLRAVLDAVRAGVSGDTTRLDGARADLAKLSGQDVPTDDSTASKPVADLKQFASDLDGKVTSFQNAFQKGGTGDLLRLQRELTEAANQADAGLKDAQSKPADEARSAVAAIRTAFAGDLTKLDEAHFHLRAITAASEQSPSGAPNVDTSEIRNRLHDLQAVVKDKNQPPDEITKRRDALSSAIAKLNDSLQGATAADSDDLRNALNAAREAASGDDAKIATATNLLAQVH